MRWPKKLGPDELRDLALAADLELEGAWRVEYFDGDDKRFPTADPADKLLNETFAKAQQIGFVTVGQNEITGRRA